MSIFFIPLLIIGNAVLICLAFNSLQNAEKAKKAHDFYLESFHKREFESILGWMTFAYNSEKREKRKIGGIYYYYCPEHKEFNLHYSYPITKYCDYTL